MTPTTPTDSFTEEQKQYLQGFFAGSAIAKSFAGATQRPDMPAGTQTPKSDRPARPEDIHLAAQDRFTAAGKKLVNEEVAKRNRHGLDAWDLVMEHARSGKFPKGTDVFLFKFQGLFYVAPAQDSFMCRLRFAGGVISAHQLRGLADIAERYAGGYVDVTTRANLQLREIGPENTIELLTGLADLGIVTRGAGADNIRNVTATPTSGLDPTELYDVRGLAKELHYYILNHRELYGLPRKFNVAFDSGGSVSVLEDTNDIGFAAVRIGEGKSVPAGVYFRFQLGGITGHKQFAKDTGILLKPEECLPVAVAAIRAFIEHGDRTDRKKARLKYVLDRMGFDGFMKEVEKHLPADLKLRNVPLEECDPRQMPIQGAHVGVHRQKQDGLYYVGLVGPAGRLTADQLRAVADIASELGNSDLRLTVWQNILIPNVAERNVASVKRRLEEAGLSASPSSIRAGVVACTGNAGCKFAATNTKRDALRIADQVESRLPILNQPLNVHLTGCPHSCAQHYIGDIGLLGTKVGDDALEGYHIYVGGGYGAKQDIGREVMRDVLADDVPAVIEKMLASYLDQRKDEQESFVDFVRRQSDGQLREVLSASGTEVLA